MKVKLAVQTLSDSVANALEILKHFEEFKGVEPTITFIRNVDILFDILNSRSIFGKLYKAPMRQDNWMENETKLKQIKSYLLKLKTIDNVLLISTKR